jgi:hypothetical protein
MMSRVWEKIGDAVILAIMPNPPQTIARNNYKHNNEHVHEDRNLQQNSPHSP